MGKPPAGSIEVHYQVEMAQLSFFMYKDIIYIYLVSHVPGKICIYSFGEERLEPSQESSVRIRSFGL